jgi:hypothetical protein
VDSDLYYGFTLIDPATERVLENAYVVVSDGRLAEIGTGEAPHGQFKSRRECQRCRGALPASRAWFQWISSTCGQWHILVYTAQVERGHPVMQRRAKVFMNNRSQLRLPAAPP